MARDEWISGNKAKNLLAWNWYNLHKHVILGFIKVLVEPGQTILYCKADVEHIAKCQAKGGRIGGNGRLMIKPELSSKLGGPIDG